jgi:hypothetical protein
MSNLNLSVNINADEVLAQYEQETVVKKVPNVFDVKNYLQARLKDGEKEKTLVIRLLPFSPEGGSPFKKVYMHQVRVNKEVSESGWKTFVCPVHNKLGDSCPFCSTSEQAKILKNSAISKIDKDKFGTIEFQNKVKEFWIVRCIERGSEDDGPKFWLFSHSKKNDGVYNKIMNISQRRYDAAKALGKVNNIFDLNEGKDLLITLTRDSNNKTVVNVVDDDEKTPLCDSYETALSWINNPKQWNDVYTVKPYEYMSIIIEGGVPIFDKESKKYVDRDIAKKEQEAKTNSEIEANLTRQTTDFSTLKEPVSDNFNEVISSGNIDDEADDLPF